MVMGAGAALLVGCRSERLALPPDVAVCSTAPEPGRGLWLQVGGEDVVRRFSGRQPVPPSPRQREGWAASGEIVSWSERIREFGATDPFRVASISKLAVAETARVMASKGILDLDADVSPLVPGGLVHPAFPGTPVTLTLLLAHLSGIVDPARYWVPAPGSVADVLGPGLFDPAAEPGRVFRYANLNYGLAATVMEAATGERFDRLATAFALAPLGVEAGFNWSGISPETKRGGATLYRGAVVSNCPVWEAQIDAPDDLHDPEPSVLLEDGADLALYRPGTNGTLFSPQGGLRTSFAGLMAMGRQWLLRPGMDEALWDAATNPGDTADGHFVAFGHGHYIYPADRSPIPGVALVGHVGEAYGFHGGLWAAPERDAVFAFGELGSPQDGVPMTGGRPNLRATNAAYFAEVAPYLL